MLKLLRLPSLYLALVALAPAHDLYLLPQSFHVLNGDKLLVLFHNGDSFPESEVAPTIARLKEAQLAGKSGSAPVLNLQIAGKETKGTVTVPGAGSLLLSVRTSPNFIELAPDKFVAYLKEEGLNQVIAWRQRNGDASKPGRERYSKFAKSLLQSGAPDDFYRHPLGFPIEIIPLADPYTIHADGKLPVQILFRGKPAADFQMEAAWSSGGRKKTVIVGRTDAEGKITVSIAKAGLWRLHSLQMERCSDPRAADWESFWASLTFEIR